ncbi:carboxymuconolactone decarboxylase family protein [Rhodopirellula sp. JC639]|uniref:carboxymuconolactone decarboxylase family protein n=1 Tax=Stieleria mannarensis TaxID=2755585 RepID=UPI0015FF05A5|nr:carboxymuconolactone decarboxylase family protein [Rhodopirellula sp. JC639]
MRADYFQLVSKEIRQLSGVEATMSGYPMGQRLLELVKLRVSQINGCAFCVRLHTQQLRLLGESDQRIDLISVWEEAPCYTDRERTAFRWAEALTRLSNGEGVDEELYETAAREFSEEGICQLSMVVAMINTWNRLAVPFQTAPRYIDAFFKKPTAAV